MYDHWDGDDSFSSIFIEPTATQVRIITHLHLQSSTQTWQPVFGNLWMFVPLIKLFGLTTQCAALGNTSDPMYLYLYWAGC